MSGRGQVKHGDRSPRAVERSAATRALKRGVNTFWHLGLEAEVSGVGGGGRAASILS